MKNNRILTVVKYLLAGNPLEFQGIPLYLSEDGRACWEVVVRSGNTTETALLPSDLTLNEFLAKCNEFSDDEIALMTANYAINRRPIAEQKSL